jgi:predicted nucleotidyltransferase component of viral defense system
VIFHFGIRDKESLGESSREVFDAETLRRRGFEIRTTRELRRV